MPIVTRKDGGGQRYPLSSRVTSLLYLFVRVCTEDEDRI